ncbi:MAG: tyrosine--tRNA ligase [Vulcanimicrobiaceae bacterium]
MLELLLAGCDHVETPAELDARLRLGHPLTVKFGVDPTGSRLHLGHAIALHKLQQFVELGHRVSLLIGDFTAKIGDPTGRSATRPPLDDAQIAENMRTYREQAGKVLDLERVEIAYNSQWLAPLRFADLIALFSKITVAQLLARNDFAQRYASGTPIALHELVYPVAVAYDSVAMRADVELGGSDQLFNLLLGREYQAGAGQPKQICMTLPILEGTDGVARMGKSRGNDVGLSDPPEEQFGKLMRIPDEMIVRYAELAAFQAPTTLARLRAELAAGSLHPMDAKKAVAAEIVGRYWGAEAARSARERFEATVQRGEAPGEMASVAAADWKSLAEVLVATGLAASKREGERLIAGGGVRIDGEAVVDPRARWQGRPPVVLSVGARRFVRIVAAAGEGATP